MRMLRILGGWVMFAVDDCTFGKANVYILYSIQTSNCWYMHFPTYDAHALKI